MTNKIEIDIFSDPVCPWCLVGLHHLDLALTKLGNVDVTIKHHPFLLDKSAPEGGEDVREMLMRKYGRAPDEMWDRIEEQARKADLALDMRKQKMRYPSQRAQVLIVAAGQRGLDQHILERNIARAYYMDGRDISDQTVLTELAVECGFSAEEVGELLAQPNAIAELEAAADMASRQGISGVPFFVINQKYALSGAQPVDAFVQVLTEVQTG